MTRRLGIAVSATLAVAVLPLLSALPAAAQDGPVSGDPRATAHAGNVTTCEDAGLEGIKIAELSGGSGDQYLTLDTGDIPAGVELTGIVVKGGNNYNVYPAGVLTKLHAPLVGDGDKNVPNISHWFACGTQSEGGQPGQPGQPCDNGQPGQPSMPNQPGQPCDNGSDSQNPSQSVGNAGTKKGSTGSGEVADASVEGEELAATGVSAVVPLSIGGALVLIGGGVLLYLRRTRSQED